MRFEVELEDVFVFFAWRGWELVVVNKETKMPYWEDELSKEGVDSIYRRRDKAVRLRNRLSSSEQANEAYPLSVRKDRDYRKAADEEAVRVI